MKVDKNTYSDIKKDMLTIINYHRIDKKTLSDYDLNNIWFHVYMNRTYDLGNKNVIKTRSGRRLLSKIEKFELYPCGTNDTTIYTVWKKLLKELNCL